jgi:hypothetical protein
VTARTTNHPSRKIDGDRSLECRTGLLIRRRVRLA